MYTFYVGIFLITMKAMTIAPSDHFNHADRRVLCMGLLAISE